MAKINIDGILAKLLYADADAADVVVAAEAAKMPASKGDAFARVYWKSRYGSEEKRLESFVQAVARLSLIWLCEPMENVRSAFGQLDHYRGSVARAAANRRDERAIVELMEAYVAVTLECRSLQEMNIQLLQRLLDVEAERSQWKPRRQRR